MLLIKDIIWKFLDKKLAEKKHEVVKLQWQKAELEEMLRQIEMKKREEAAQQEKDREENRGF